MADIAMSSCTVHKDVMPSGLIKLTIISPATADNADVLTPITLADYGIKTFIKCVGTYQSTANSVSVEVAFTTSVTSGVLSVTLDSTAGSDKVRIAEITGSC